MDEAQAEELDAVVAGESDVFAIIFRERSAGDRRAGQGHSLVRQYETTASDHTGGAISFDVIDHQLDQAIRYQHARSWVKHTEQVWKIDPDFALLCRHRGGEDIDFAATGDRDGLFAFERPR